MVTFNSSTLRPVYITNYGGYSYKSWGRLSRIFKTDHSRLYRSLQLCNAILSTRLPTLGVDSIIEQKLPEITANVSRGVYFHYRSCDHWQVFWKCENRFWDWIIFNHEVDTVITTTPPPPTAMELEASAWQWRVRSLYCSRMWTAANFSFVYAKTNAGQTCLR